jgi:hypothetical protein
MRVALTERLEAIAEEAFAKHAYAERTQGHRDAFWPRGRKGG